MSDVVTKQLNRAVAEYQRLSNEWMRLEDELARARAEKLTIQDRIKRLVIDRDRVKELAMCQRATVAALLKQQDQDG